MRTSFESCIFATVTKCSQYSPLSSESAGMTYCPLLLSVFSSLKSKAPLILLYSDVFASCSSAVDCRQYGVLKVPEKFHNFKVSELKQNLISF